MLIGSYLSTRKQRVKIGSSRSKWLPLNKGVPQGSILGPILFNVFIHDMYYFINSTLLNYADDNTIISISRSQDTIISSLSHDAIEAVKWFHDNGMQANPEKFQVMISHKSVRIFKDVPIGDINLTPQTSVKLLGITFDIDLSFISRIDDICKKASKSLNVLKRFSKTLSVENKKRIFHTFISSQFNYCSIIWHFSSKRKIYMLEKIQERALRFVYNYHQCSYRNLLDFIKKDPLYIQRLKCILVLVYKCVNKLCSDYINDLFFIKLSPYSMRNDCILLQPKVKSSFHGINSILYHGSKMWNSLPKYIKDARDVNQFKYLLKKYKNTLCNCNHCSININ